MEAIEVCRTAALGGHVHVCTECGYERPFYNSCRNRHCPKCQSLAQAKWLKERKERILPTHYFHVVFTLPQQLRALAQQNPRKLYSLLFACSADTLHTLARDDKWLGAQLGFTSVLHTWARTMHYHPHVHCIVTGGGLDADGKQWLACRRNFLFPKDVMSKLFRGKFLDGLQHLYDRGELNFRGCEHLAEVDAFRRLKSELYQKKWVVYIKPPFGSAEKVYTYLGRYTHRVAISNSRLIEATDDKIRFATKHGKTTTLAPTEFIRRFLLHVLPKGFVKTRHYGLLASANATTKLEVARALLTGGSDKQPDDKQPDDKQPLINTELPREEWEQRYKELTGIDLLLCPRCQRPTIERRPLPLGESVNDVPKEGFLDSS